MTTWTEIKLKIDSQAQEAISNILMDLGSSGASIHDPEEIKKIKQTNYLIWSGEDLKIEDSRQLLVTGYFSEDSDIEEIECELDDKIDKLLELGLLTSRPEITVEDIYEEDWQNTFEEHYEPIHISRYLQIVPAGKIHSKKVEKTSQSVILDPGLAFGTGQHPTTVLAMLGLEKVMRGGEKVIDVGSGSGVLSITAARLGAGQVTACDIDPQAVESTESNWELNQLDIPFQAFTNDLLHDVEDSFDIIVGNIVAEYVAQLIPQAKSLLKQEGYLIVSGVLNNLQEDVLAAVEENEFEILLELEMQDWVAYILKRKL
ncbi:MAG: 50S ribosomal protein L11 methyltransferase [Atopococcus tabaci]|uniref:Ribosomal protein L11 methyltransferase n=1 Tax=Atopococcus tabaci TaxID=269774 RepID=A0AA43U744_9LACT|nr:50S ribosomal protein L11 methyltransferase [Atopococcus tabaci]